MIEMNDKGFYVTSDHHFFHKNIIKYCDRPFSSVDEMNKTLVENWNNTVNEDDVVFFLGDFTFHSRRVAKMLWDGLAGEKYFMFGNHDKKKFCEETLTEDSHQSIEVSYRGFTITLSHRPLDQFSTNFLIHGHIHNNQDYFELNTFNCSVEMTDYKPIHIDDVLKKIYKQNQILKLSK